MAKENFEKEEQIARKIEDEEESMPYILVAQMKNYVKKGEKAVPHLLEALMHDDWVVRLHAARTLGVIGKKAKAAVPALTDILRDEIDLVRFESAFSLAEICGVTQDSILVLVEALNQDKITLSKILQVIEMIDNKEIVISLIKNLEQNKQELLEKIAPSLEIIINRLGHSNLKELLQQ